ncbi:MAG TPA: hypothetical protein PKI01_10265 [Bacteroidales bacterium]|nr:hypothetical protein [Bacteroidales bacterium]
MSIEIIDKNSAYFRICKECENEFMAKDYREKYCSDECGQRFRDRKKRIKKLVLPPSKQEIPTTVPLDTDREKFLRKNIEILKGRYLIGKDGMVVFTNELIEAGFNFEVYHSRLPYSMGTKFYLEYGPYILSRETENKVFIKIKQK